MAATVQDHVNTYRVTLNENLESYIQTYGRLCRACRPNNKHDFEGWKAFGRQKAALEQLIRDKKPHARFTDTGTVSF